MTVIELWRHAHSLDSQHKHPRKDLCHPQLLAGQLNASLSDLNSLADNPLAQLSEPGFQHIVVLSNDFWPFLTTCQYRKTHVDRKQHGNYCVGKFLNTVQNRAQAYPKKMADGPVFPDDNSNTLSDWDAQIVVTKTHIEFKVCLSQTKSYIVDMYVPVWNVSEEHD